MARGCWVIPTSQAQLPLLFGDAISFLRSGSRSPAVGVLGREWRQRPPPALPRGSRRPFYWLGGDARFVGKTGLVDREFFGAGGGLVRPVGRVVRAALTSGEECPGADGSGEDFPDDAGVFHPGQAFG